MEDLACRGSSKKQKLIVDVPKEEYGKRNGRKPEKKDQTISLRQERE